MESNNKCRLMWKFLNHVNSKTVNTDINTNDVNDVNDVNHQTYEPIYKLQMLNTIEDERDAIQKKTFTKWVNKHLIKHWIYTETYTCLHVCNDNCFTECNEVTKGVVDLFEDLRDGHNLISLLEVLSGEILSRERGRMRVHMLQNIQICLDFLKRRKIKLVNIRADDIVDGNPKLTLGLIWTIILHFQLSDIVLHDDTQSFKEALLRWAQKTTEGYPGVNVKDFTQSWRDGLAFNAILHRNRPDLLDYRSCRGRTARENLENAFHVADKDLGVTRLLDPEDVDTPHPDEKSLITYISSLYELFPEPPEHNPLLDLERIRRIDEYKDLASRLCVWMRESIVRLREKNFPNTLQEMKVLQQDNNRFRTEEIPPKLHDKQRLASSYKDIIKMVRALPGGHHRIEEEYKIENIEHQWNKVITAHSERDHAINEEIQRLERLHRLAEKLLRDIKQCDIKLDDIERQIVEEEKRVQRLHPLDTKFNIDKIEAELRDEGERIQSMFKDVQSLREGRYHKATELHNRVQQLHQRWSDMKLEFQTRVVELLAQRRAEALKKPLTEEELIAKYHSFRFIHECILWVQEKHKKLESLEYGHDLSSVKDNLDQQKVEHRSIEQFQSKVDQCDRNKLEFKGEEYEVYCRMLNRLNKGFSELIVFSNKRLSDLDTLLDFVQSASNELKWLTDKEDVEVSRDWSSKTLNLVEVEQQHRQLISDMERREHQFNIVQERGESLIRQRHPATKCIEGLMARMQSQWSWLLQLINCLEVHSKNAGDYHQFFNEARDCDQWLAKTEDKLNTTYSKQNFSLEEGEQLLKEMNRLKEDITRFGSVVNDLVSKSKDVHPLKQRRAALPRPVKVRSVCLIKQDNKTITKNESVTLHDNSRLSKWRITTSTGAELNVPGVCFVIPPPDQEAIDTANDLRKRYEALVALWARKQHKLRQNMIFATLKIVKGWDYPTYCAMDPHQRDSILRALDDDIDKICREGPSDDPGNQRLRDEMDALRKKFAEFDARRRAEEEEKSNSTLTKKYTDAASNLLEKLLEKERILVQRCQNPIPRNRESLEQLVVEHKEWEIDTKSYESEVQRCKELFQNIPQKSPTVQRNYDEILEKWNSIWNLSQLYIERLKTVETVLFDLEKASQVITKAEIQLASGDDMPADEVALRRAHNELIDTQNDIQRNKSTFEELTVSITKVRRIVERTRSKTFTHSDVNRLEDDVKNLIKRLDNCGETLIERLRLLEACADLLRQYKKRMDSERSWISQIAAKVNTLLTRPDQESAIRLNEQLVERKPSIEDTNASGARFIREAKIHDLKIKSYRENLEDSHPSLDASAKRSRRTPGADIVIQELDQLNSDYKELLENMQRLLNKQLQEIKLTNILSFKTYHNDLGIAVVNQTSNQMDFNNDINTTTTTTTTTTTSLTMSNQQTDKPIISQTNDFNHNKIEYEMNAKTCKTTSTLVLKTGDTESVNIKQNLKELVSNVDEDSAVGVIDSNVNKLGTQTLTFSEIKSSRRQKSESTETDEITDKPEASARSTSRSSSPPSPKKAKSASDIVRESMKSKRLSNKVESRFDIRSRSPTKHTTVVLNSSSNSIPTSDKSDSSPERMSYSGSSSSPTHSPVRPKAKSSRRTSPEKGVVFSEMSSSMSQSMSQSMKQSMKSYSKDIVTKSEFSSSTYEERETKKSYKSKRNDSKESEKSRESVYISKTKSLPSDPNIRSDSDISDKLTKSSAHKESLITDSQNVESMVSYSDSDESVTYDLAIKRGIIDKETGLIVAQKGDEKLSIAEMSKRGLLALATSPIALAHTLSSTYTSDSIAPVRKSVTISEEKPIEIVTIRDIRSESPITNKKLIRETVQTIKSKELFIKDPKTQREVPLDEAIKLGLIDSQTANDLKALDDEVDGHREVTLKEVTISDPITGESLPLNIAVEKGLIDSETAKCLEKRQIIDNVVTTTETVESAINGKYITTIEKPQTSTKILRSSSLSKSNSSSSAHSSPTQSPSGLRSPKSRVSDEESHFELSLSGPQDIQSFERVTAIEKVAQRKLSLNTALEEQLIDRETANIIKSVTQTMPLDRAIIENVIDGDKGSIIEPQSGQSVSIRKALHLGLIDVDTKQLIYPLKRSLSLPSLIQKGLYNPKERLLIHPETGQLLTLSQAIANDIVDKNSKLMDPKTKKSITLEEAINKGIIDSVTGDVTTVSDRKLSIVEAIKTNYLRLPTVAFKESSKPKSSSVPELAFSYTAALKSGFLNKESQEFTHPITKEVMPINTAIEKGFIDEVKTTELPTDKQYITVTQKPVTDISKQLAETLTESSSAKTSQSNELTELTGKDMILQMGEQNDKQLIKSKDLPFGDTIPKSTVVTIDSKGAAQVVHTTVETVITSTGEVTMRTSSAVQSMADATKMATVSVTAGTVTSPTTGEPLKITEPLVKRSQAVEMSTQTGDKYTIFSAFNNLYDSNTNKWREPETKQLISFDELVSKGVIDLDAVIYDSIEEKTKTTADAIREGRIDIQTENLIIDAKANKVLPITEALTRGLLTVVGVPVHATQSVAAQPLVKQKTSESKTIQTDSMTEPEKRTTASTKSQTEVSRQREISTSTTLFPSDLQNLEDQLTATLRWLSDTEEEMANQKPISADYQVVKAQLQEQKLFKKLITDKETSVRSLLSSAKTLIQSMDSHERAPIEKQMHEITRRFDALLSACNDRMASLEQTLPIARAFAERIGPLGDWLESSERKLAQLSTQIPTDQNRIRKRIQEHESLHRDIIGHKRDFEELTEIAQNLMSLIGDDEAQDVVERLQRLTDRYAKLVEDSIALGQLLSQSHEVLGSFVLSFEDILAWIQEMESRLNRYRVLSVFVDKLKEQVDELTELSEEIHSHQKQVSDIVRSGQEIMKHSSGGDSIFIKEKLDSLQSRFSELTHKATEKLMQAKESLPICQNFHKAHNNLNAWMDNAERELKNIGSLNLSSQEKIITKLEKEIPDNRTLLETLNHLGPQLSQISPGQGAATIEGFVTRASRRFDAICEQIQRKAERIEIEKQRNNQILVDIDELLDWFRDAEKQLLEAEPITPNPDALAILLKETKALNDDINSQKGRVRDVITNAKKLLRESSGEDLIEIRDKAEDLRELANHVSQLCQDRLNALEQALPLAIHFFEAHIELSQWLDEVENEAQMLGKPGINATQIRRQQEMTKSLIQSIAERKPLVDKLNKTGAALMRIIYEEDARQVQKIMDSDNDRYNRLKNLLREQQQALEAALQAHSQFADKLDGMLNALNNTADQLRNAEPIAAHPDRIREQIVDNNAIINDLDKKAGAVEALKSAARDVISKAGKSDEPAIRDIRKKLDKLNDLWDEVQKNSKNRDHSLNDALKVAEKFWNELNNVMKAIYDLQDTLNNQEPPATEPNEIKQQQHQLKEIKHDMDQTKPEVDHCKQTGRDLLKLCGEPDKPEVKKHLDDLDNAWDNVTSLYAKREKNLIDAMDKAMNFHEMLRNLFNFLDKAEHKYESLGPIAGDIDTVKRQQRELKEFQHEVNQHMVEIEALNRAAHELLEDVSPDQARSIRGPVNEINRRWDELLKNINDRQTDLDNALLRLGQFQHALNDFLQWITKTERTLDEMRPVFGDPPVIEVELAKHKVLMNDILAHQSSLDSLNIAGKQMLALERDTESARSTKRKLEELNSRWEQLIAKAHQRQRELEDALREAQGFNQEIQNLLAWLNDVDAQLSSSKPVGGLPETAREQLNRFMELYTELEATRPKVESVLKQGEDYLRRSTEGAATNLQHNVKTLRQRWENVLSRANDRKIKLEIALREATEFHEALQEFVDWLTSSEKYLTNLQPVSRIVDSVLQQIEEHKNFQKDIAGHRETMLNLDKKGTHLKYFSQKQDVILIKNLLVSVQHRWERVVSKAAERTRALDHGFKEAKEFLDAWTELMSWLSDAEKTLDSIQQMSNNPELIKQMLLKHKEFQRSLGAKQSIYDATIKLGRTLKEKAPKSDGPTLQDMIDELKNKWNSVCNKSVDRQRKLEEALLYSGQFKDAIQALIDWLDKAKRELAMDMPVYGDLDTVTALVENHKTFQEEFKSRAKNLESVRKTSRDLLQTANAEDARHIKEQMSLLENKWEEVSRMSEEKQIRLEDALRQAEQLHKSVHMLLEWLSDAEMKLRFAGPLPEDEATTRQQIAEHERFMREMAAQEKNKDATIALAQEILQKCHPDATPVIRHWITIIQSRWEEVAAWAQQREQRLQDHLRSLKNIMDLLEELLAWLIGAEASLLAAEAEPLPDDVLALERLIEEHQRFIDDMIRKEPDVEKVAKAFTTKRTTKEQIRAGIDKGRRGYPPRTSTPTRGIEPEIKHPRARELLEKWSTVWKLAMDRMKRLQDKLNYNRELDRMRNFDFDEWRRRFLGWMNNKKARIMDFFRKIDTDNDGKVTKSEFVEGFLNSKFPTSRLEMTRVVDIFDRNNDGYVDQKEYLDTLRPDRDQPKTEAEIIEDEVQRQVNKCNCLTKYKVHQVGEGRYRFGESQKLRLVRILRSTVMVRVGGGWVSLDEFLVKNDPCRAKGRTNVELREQFILAEGVSQSMTPFKSKSPIRPDGTISTTGPITKIREKSERSVPMSHSHHYRYGNSTSDYSFSDQADSSGASKGRPISRLTVGSGSKPNSRPGSRHSSRPSSRAGSDMSVESLEGYQQRRSQSVTRTKLGFTSTKTNGTNGRQEWKNY
ncbi:microtubule-actin cross-linking factor 1-like isoform X2 [Oppia nitens]|uniref:microtubule-actin cross-linking factor 1-like isoform X2 n=1 Tax=Oppia nitens TaxID=1686743 RepID=UPI0023DB940F|nr:microtubule-actin cross-linking factor 1-like isoform X2 [Oppia nitens]